MGRRGKPLVAGETHQVQFLIAAAWQLGGKLLFIIILPCMSVLASSGWQNDWPHSVLLQWQQKWHMYPTLSDFA